MRNRLVAGYHVDARFGSVIASRVYIDHTPLLGDIGGVFGIRIRLVFLPISSRRSEPFFSMIIKRWADFFPALKVERRKVYLFTIHILSFAATAHSRRNHHDQRKYILVFEGRLV